MCIRDRLEQLKGLLRFGDLGLHLTTPWRVVLTGPPNVGKSSLINALVGRERAIGSAQPGTTRDVVTAVTAVGGWPIELADTAGVRQVVDPLEREGVNRAKRSREHADLVVMVADATQNAPPEDLFEGNGSERAVLVVVNNQWAISTHRNLAHGGSSFAARGIPYDVASMRVDGQDFLAVFAAHKWATERARAGHGPTLLEMYTYRGDSHSSSDDPSIYRPGDEYDSWPLGDPVDRLKAHLVKLGEWDDERHAALEAQCLSLIHI